MSENGNVLSNYPPLSEDQRQAARLHARERVKHAPGQLVQVRLLGWQFVQAPWLEDPVRVVVRFRARHPERNAHRHRPVELLRAGVTGRECDRAGPRSLLVAVCLHHHRAVCATDHERLCRSLRNRHTRHVEL